MVDESCIGKVVRYDYDKNDKLLVRVTSLAKDYKRSYSFVGRCLVDYYNSDTYSVHKKGRILKTWCGENFSLDEEETFKYLIKKAKKGKPRSKTLKK
jgi:hypothetical protein